MRKLTQTELELMYKTAADKILNRFLADCARNLVPLRQIEIEWGASAQAPTPLVVHSEIHMRCLDIACLSMIANFVMFAVTPLGRNKFLSDLQRGVDNLTNQAATQTSDGKIVVQ